MSGGVGISEYSALFAVAAVVTEQPHEDEERESMLRPLLSLKYGGLGWTGHGRLSWFGRWRAHSVVNVGH